MSDVQIYIAPLVTEDVDELYDVGWHSPAAQNKIRGVIQSIEGDVINISPIVQKSTEFSLTPQRNTKDGVTGATTIVPPMVNIYGIQYINRLILAFSTIILTLKIHFYKETNSTIFYNFRIVTALPAYIAQVVLDKPAILEYEDGLFTQKTSPSGIIAYVLRKTIGERIKGALCVNTQLASLLTTDNIAIVRGYPSVGYPKELPEPIFEDDDTVVMFAGTFDRVRGIDKFLSIIPQIEDRDVTFWISGTGSKQELQRIRNATNKLDDDRVEYFGSLPWEEYRRRLVSADVFVNFQNPNANISDYTFPSKLLDFLSAGGLIVSTDMGDIPTTFDNEIQISGYEDDELANTLQSAIECVREGRFSKKSQREWIKQNCSHSVMGNQINKVIERSKK